MHSLHQWQSKMLAPLLLLICVLGCRPTTENFKRDENRALQAYSSAADPQAAKAALLDWEKTLAKYEEAHTKSTSMPWQKQVLYTRLFAVHTRLGETNEAQRVQQKLAKHMFPNFAGAQFDMQPLLNSIEDLDRRDEVRWRDAK
jgi:hypothetical protein